MIKLNQEAFEYAKKLIQEDKIDRTSGWSQEDQPSAEQQNKFIENNGMSQYSKWFLGINTENDPEDKGYWEFPYGDFTNIYRSGVIAAEQRAGQYHHKDIEKAAKELLDLIDKK